LYGSVRVFYIRGVVCAMKQVLLCASYCFCEVLIQLMDGFCYSVIVVWIRTETYAHG
jgi:hypothetical protein